MTVDREALAELRRLWKKRKPFLMQMEVRAPYDGCFYEPNLFLVTPPGSKMQVELMADIPSRYSPRRELCAKQEAEARAARSSAEWQFDWMWAQARGDRWGSADPQAKNKLAKLFDALDEARELEIDAAVNGSLARAADPSSMEQPDLYVWPLYATGQGVGMDCVHGLHELVSVCERESVHGLATRARWPDGLEGSRLLKEHSGYGRISLVEVAAMGPINEVLPAGERYWMHALHVAERWGVELQWKCEGCGSVITYDEYEGRPEATGYVGDGGIGVHPKGVLCDQCLLEGACDRCRDASGDPMEYYWKEIKENGWHLCEDCAKELLKSAGLAGDVSLGDTVHLRRYKDESQSELADWGGSGPLVFVDGDDKPIKSLTFDAEALTEKAEEMRLEHLHPQYGYGLSLSGSVVEQLASEGLKDA